MDAEDENACDRAVWHNHRKRLADETVSTLSQTHNTHNTISVVTRVVDDLSGPGYPVWN